MAPAPSISPGATAAGADCVTTTALGEVANGANSIGAMLRIVSIPITTYASMYRSEQQPRL